MIMVLELIICFGLISLGATLWWWIERRTESLVKQERRETERWRKAYTDLRLQNLPPWEDGLAPMPLQLDQQDASSLAAFGKTARKRIHTQKARA